MTKKFSVAVVCTSLLLSAGIETGIAGETVPAPETPLAAASPPETGVDLWDVDARVDGWIFQVDMRLTDDAIGLDDNFFIGFDDFLKNMDWVVPVGLDVRYGRFGFMPDLVGFKISGSSAASGGRMAYETASLDMTTLVLNLVGYFRVIDKPDFSFDLLGGARYLYAHAQVTLSGGQLGQDLAEHTARLGRRIEREEERIAREAEQKIDEAIYERLENSGLEDSPLGRRLARRIEERAVAGVNAVTEEILDRLEMREEERLSALIDRQTGRDGEFTAGTRSHIWNGIVGGRVSGNLNDRVFYWVYGDVGTGDSDLTWQIWANLGYQFTEHLSIAAGYRYLDWKESPGEADLDLKASGPIITVNWEF